MLIQPPDPLNLAIRAIKDPAFRAELRVHPPTGVTFTDKGYGFQISVLEAEIGGKVPFKRGFTLQANAYAKTLVKDVPVTFSSRYVGTDFRDKPGSSRTNRHYIRSSLVADVSGDYEVRGLGNRVVMRFSNESARPFSVVVVTGVKNIAPAYKITNDEWFKYFLATSSEAKFHRESDCKLSRSYPPQRNAMNLISYTPGKLTSHFMNSYSRIWTNPPRDKSIRAASWFTDSDYSKLVQCLRVDMGIGRGFYFLQPTANEIAAFRKSQRAK